jgi:hypothetical protein
VFGFLARAGGFDHRAGLALGRTEALDPVAGGLLIVGPLLAVFPAVWLGRRSLDARRRWSTRRVNSLIHFALMVLFGGDRRGRPDGPELAGLDDPGTRIGLALVRVTGLVTILTVVNLAVRGLGAPFAIALSRRLATDWMYRWTRNPMVLAVLAFLVSFGVWIRSALFVVWVLLLVTPAWLYFLTAYEERELEIRFGEPYLEYKARTPMLLPGKPRR